MKIIYAGKNIASLCLLNWKRRFNAPARNWFEPPSVFTLHCHCQRYFIKMWIIQFNYRSILSINKMWRIIQRLISNVCSTFSKDAHKIIYMCDSFAYNTCRDSHLNRKLIRKQEWKSANKLNLKIDLLITHTHTFIRTRAAASRF